MNSINGMKQLSEKIEKLETKMDFLENQIETIKKFTTSERLQTYLNKVDKVQKMSKLFVSLDESDNEIAEKLRNENKNVIDNMFKQSDIADISVNYGGVKEYASKLDRELEEIENYVDEQLSKHNWDDICEYEIKDGGVIIKKYFALEEKEVTVPTRINGYTVTEIGDKAFEGCKNILLIDLPDSIVRIGHRAFLNCGLIKFKLPRQLKIIGNQAFFSCPFTEISIPESVSEIGSYSFSKCTNLLRITLPKNLKIINEGAFLDCVKLEYIDIPDSVTKIDYRCFSGCRNLLKITLSKSNRMIWAETFQDCSSLQYIDIPEGTYSIAPNAFVGCLELRYIRLPNSVQKLGDGLLFFIKSASAEKPIIYCNSGSEAIKYARRHKFNIDKYENYRELRK